MSLQSVPSVTIDRFFEHYGHMHYSVNGILELLPANFRGKNATVEMRERFVEYMNLVNKNIFVSYPPELRAKVAQERLQKILRDSPPDLLSYAITLITQITIIIFIFSLIQKRISRS
jgi:hypothetical protein